MQALYQLSYSPLRSPLRPGLPGDDANITRSPAAHHQIVSALSGYAASMPDPAVRLAQAVTNE